MKKSEFDELFKSVLDRCSKELQEEIKKLPRPCSPETMAEYTASIISLSMSMATQVTYDTIVNLGVLESDR